MKRRRERIAKEIKRGDKPAFAEDAVLAKLEAALDAGKPALLVELSADERARAWTIRLGDTAPAAARVIHSDFERGFIKAETVSYGDLVASGSLAAARECGVYRMEGKEYVVKDGDVLLFKFNV